MRAAKRDLRRGVSLVLSVVFVIGLCVAPAAHGRQRAGAPRAGESPLVIGHDPLGCVTTDMAPLVDAQVAPPPRFDRGYVYFRAAGTEDFYYTPMKGVPQNLEGVLPRPLPEIKAIDYKVRARDVESLNAETKEYTPPVVPGNACKSKGMVVGKDGAGLTIGLTREGQNPVPPGFNRRDIAFVILFSGATVAVAQALQGTSGATTSTAAKAGGGGGGKTALIVGGVVAAGAAAAIIANNTKSNNTATPTAVPTSTPTATPTATRTATPTLVSQRLIEADAVWSGPGDVDVQIVNASGQSVGTNLPAGCESTAQRSERVLLQGTVPDGTYRVMLTGKGCGAGTPATIAVALTVLSDSGPKCATSFLNVPVAGTIQGCQFTLP
jgi:hypothetical protein